MKAHRAAAVPTFFVGRESGEPPAAPSGRRWYMDLLDHKQHGLRSAEHHLFVLHYDATKDTHIWTCDYNSPHICLQGNLPLLCHTDTHSISINRIKTLLSRKRSEVRPLKGKYRHPPSSSIHFNVIGCNLATLHRIFTSSHNCSKVKEAGKSVISMSLNATQNREGHKERQNDWFYWGREAE